MSPSPQFRLQWKNHLPNFISVFAQLLNSESLVDVTLSADGRQIQAHRVVLSACSSYFKVSGKLQHKQKKQVTNYSMQYLGITIFF